MKKGFTLIELLAVIVILAIIALIATPMILGVIDDAKQGSAKSSALGYIDAVEKANILAEVSPASYTALASNDVHNVTPLTTLSVKGAKPTSGWVAVGTDGTVEAAVLYFSGIHTSKMVKYYNNVTTIVDYAVDSTLLEEPADNAAAIVKVNN